MTGSGCRLPFYLPYPPSILQHYKEQLLEPFRKSFLFTTVAIDVLLVAINKCDKPEAEVEACIEDLAQNGIVLEEKGGDILGVKISALKGNDHFHDYYFCEAACSYQPGLEAAILSRLTKCKLSSLELHINIHPLL